MRLEAILDAKIPNPEIVMNTITKFNQLIETGYGKEAVIGINPSCF